LVTVSKEYPPVALLGALTAQSPQPYAWQLMLADAVTALLTLIPHAKSQVT
jgi:hypothetical protein